MAQIAALEIARFYKRRLQERGVRVSRLVLFGSSASGTADEGSDVDVAVVSKDFCGKNVFERSRLAGPAELETIRRFQVPMDVLLMTPEEYESESSPIAHAVQSGGVVH